MNMFSDRVTVCRTALSLVVFLIVSVVAVGQTRSTLFENIELSIAQREPEWVLMEKWPNPNPEYRVITYQWVERAETKERKAILAWMMEERSAEDAARMFYEISQTATQNSFQQVQIGDKCYVSSSPQGVNILLRKATLVVKLTTFGAVSGPIAPDDVVIRFAQHIASAVPSAPMFTSSSPGGEKPAKSHIEKAELAFKERRYQDAVEEFRKAIELDRESTDAYYGLGLAYLKTGERIKAIEAFREAIRLRPEWAEAHNQLGLTYYEAGEYKTAASAFEEATRLKPDFFDALVALGNTYQHSGLYARAVEVLEKAVLLRPENIDAKMALGRALILAARPEDAVTVLKDAVRLSPNSALVYSILGQAYRLTGKYEEALTALDQALRINADDPVAYNYLGLTYENLERQQEAIAAYRRAITLKADYAEAHYNLALILLSRGERTQAQAEYLILKNLNSDLADVLLQKIVNSNRR